MAPARRDQWFDLALTAFLLVFTAFGTAPAAANQGQHPPAAAYLIALLAALALVFWHSRPLWTFVGVGAAGVLYLGAGYPYGPVMVTLALAVYGLCARSRLRTSLVASAILVTAGAVALGVGVVAGSRQWSDLATVVAWVALPAASGMVIRTRRDARAAVRAEQARRAVSEERLRLAQEVHDVAGHGFAVIAMQSGVALRVLDRDPAAARAALAAIRSASTEALAELRAEVQALRQGRDAVPLRPHSGLGDLPALADRMRASGLPVTIESTVDADGLPADLGPAAYRIVQESLTNVLRHAGPAATAKVHIGRSGDILEIDVVDTGRGGTAAPGGTGIDGMRGRAEALGGTLMAAPLPQGGFAVRAQLPLSTQPSGGVA
ncbi:MAG TPA: histidine kinase [Micromonosporaceae bacterium]